MMLTLREFSLSSMNMSTYMACGIVHYAESDVLHALFPPLFLNICDIIKHVDLAARCYSAFSVLASVLYTHYHKTC